MADTIDWRKLPVRRSSSYESLVEKLCSTKSGADVKTIFPNIKEFMVFAALVAFQLDIYEPLHSKNSTIPILLETYASTEHDSYIYLIAIAKKQSLDILKDDSLKDAISIFEGYCNAGLKHIDNWVINNIGDPIMGNILFNQTLEHLNDNE
jgi:dnd system-associated protein 4